MTPPPVSDELGLWPVRREAEALALHLQAGLGGMLYRPWLHVVGGAVALSQRQQFALAYRRHRQWIMVGAAGIAVRFLDGLPQDKHSDPAVVVLDEAGRFAISLLAGHEGGANRLAYRVAQLTGALPVVTTATEAVKPLVLGIGCRKGVSAERITAAVTQALAQCPEATLQQVREVATIDIKAEEPGLLAFCATHDLPLRVISTAQIAQRAWVGKGSDWVMQNVGVEGVCEPAALIACPRGRLALGKTALDGVTVAVVEDAAGWQPTRPTQPE
ncbi:cobalamin biosynthesis protein [Herbaspirillum sp. YR522]|uniref:cobalamin biosynthesis protein n=1 Tax=Herbaspirillum sp. YR522 TaxID=1144342 RepID=UPI00026F90FF|nr:cobalamin biosynthesis protein [Herbaspirillum sp. YR522]EJN06959.1 cobalamin biosynthesis protein CbiG [Herbaspirillum sp. YR522]